MKKEEACGQQVVDDTSDVIFPIELADGRTKERAHLYCRCQSGQQ